MKHNFLYTLVSGPLFLILLPLFYFLNGLNRYYYPTVVPDALWLTAVYTGIGFLLTGIAWLFFRRLRNASLFALYLLSIQFFFGSLHDWLKQVAPGTIITKYTLLLPLLLAVTIALFLYLKKKKEHVRLCTYVNLLLGVLLFMELFALRQKNRENRQAMVPSMDNQLTACDTCVKPDIYFIVADEYAGDKTLRDIFGFDNSDFGDQLRQRGFRVLSGTHSNYNATIYSLASTFSLNYLNHLSADKVNHRDMLRCKGLLKDNNFMRFLQRLGYHFYNYSFFDIADRPRMYHEHFFPDNRQLLTFQLFTERLQRHLGYHLFSEKTVENILRNKMKYNIQADSLTRNLRSPVYRSPAFVYTHLSMPHHPYYFNSKGEMTPLEQLQEVDKMKVNKGAYIEYLRYTNSRLLAICDTIIRHNPSPPVIIVLGDHGFRQYSQPVDNEYWFLNVSAIYLPDGNYAGFRDGMTNVNLLRQLLNNQFGQRLAPLRDSTVFLPE